MKSTDLMEALGDVPEELVRAGLGLPQDTADYAETASPETVAADTEMPTQQERFSVITKIILTAGVLAACIALAVGAVMLIGRLREKPQPLQQPGGESAAKIETELVTNSTAVQISESTAATVMSEPLLNTVPFRLWHQTDLMLDQTGIDKALCSGLESAVIRDEKTLHSIAKAFNWRLEYADGFFAENSLIFIQRDFPCVNPEMPRITAITAETQEIYPPVHAITVHADYVPGTAEAEDSWFALIEVKTKDIIGSGEGETRIRLDMHADAAVSGTEMPGETVYTVSGITATSPSAATTAATEPTKTTPEADITTTDPNDTGKQSGTGKTEQTETVPPPWSPIRKEPAYSVKYEFCNFSGVWPEQFTQMSMNGTFGQIGSNCLIRSREQLERMQCGFLDVTQEYFENKSLIFLRAEFPNGCEKPVIESVLLEKREQNKDSYDITVSANRIDGTEACIYRWIAFLEVNNSDLEGLEREEWYQANVTLHIYHQPDEFGPVSFDAVGSISMQQKGYYAWFDSRDENVSTFYLYSELQMTPEVLCRCAHGSVSVIRNGSTVFGVAGNPLVNAYFADLNRDGSPELCVTWGMGSGIYSQHVAIYDYKNDVKYVMTGRTASDYTLFTENGRLLMKATPATGSPAIEDCEVYEYGTLRIEDGNLEFDARPSAMTAEQLKREISEQIEALGFREKRPENVRPRYQLTASDGTVYCISLNGAVWKKDTDTYAALPETLLKRIFGNMSVLGVCSALD